MIGVENFSGPSYGIERIWLDNDYVEWPSVVEAYWNLSAVDWDFSSVDFLDMGDFYLTDGNDRIVCPASSDNHVNVFGEYGNDTIVGGPIDEALFGDWGDTSSNVGDGSDVISGGPGNDKIVGEGGADVLSGGAGDDEFFFAGAFGNDEILDFEPDADSSTGDKIYLDYDANFSDIEVLISQSVANTFVIDLTSLGGGVLEVTGSGTLTELKETDFFFGGFYPFA